LKVIGRAGIGVDNVDLAAATAHGVKVINTPRANSVATAEQTLALMLAVSRHTVAAHNSVAAGEWNRAQFVGTELAEKTLGVIGLGYIGRLVARRAQAFDMTVIAYDPYVSAEDAAALDITLLPLEKMLAQADIITLHSVVTPETTNMINATTIAQMKDGAIIINVARGKLIDEQALADALQSGKLAAAALDVFQKEPPVGSPVLTAPNVLHTPHLGASSKEAQKRVGVEIVEQVVDALRGTAFRNVVNG
jgi:D-3-phosphoglycerate dehydrogenase